MIKDYSVYRNRSVHDPRTNWTEGRLQTSADLIGLFPRRFHGQRRNYPVTQDNSHLSQSVSLDKRYNSRSARVYPKVLMEHLNDYYLDTKTRMIRVQAQLQRIQKHVLPMVYLSPEEPSIDERFDLITLEPAFDWRKRDEACACRFLRYLYRWYHFVWSMDKLET
jgi:hypothetical protein